MDVIEIDAASHGLVEDARDLVMRALTAPSELKRRVYIIDEVHMLSTHAFNALLKLIEEPPDHVVFILATTDTHKVPATIISRTQRHDFRRLAEPTIAGKLLRICEAEGAAADADALALIARLADGGMRDAESLLDQVLAFAPGRVTVEDVREAVGLADDASIGDAGGRVHRRRRVRRARASCRPGRRRARRRPGGGAGRGRSSPAFARRRVGRPTARRLAPILRTLAEAAGAGAREGRARLMLELLAVESAGTPGADAIAAVSVQPASPATARTASSPPAAKPRQREGTQREAPTAAPPPEPVAPAAPPQTDAAPPVAAGAASAPQPVAAEVADLRARWAEVVERASPVIKPLLKECRPVARDGARLTLAFPEGRDFMRGRIAQRSAAIEALLAEMFGGPFAIECVASNLELEPLTVAQAVGDDPDDPEARALLEGVLKITGGELVDAPEVR
jgi:DNA polymerase III subunit gamma/tau